MVVVEIPPDDEMLVRLAQERTTQGKSTQRSQAAFEALYERYQSQIFHYISLHGIGQYQTAEDLTQETFTKAWRGLPGKSPDAPFQRWLFVIAINEVNSHFRGLRSKKHAALVSSLEGIAEKNPGALPPCAAPAIDEYLMQLEDIAHTFDELPLRERQCLTLVYKDGFSVAEVASMLHIKENSVTGALSRARQHFKHHYHRLA